MSALLSLNKKIDYNINWQLPTEEEFYDSFTQSKNVFDYRAHSNLQNTQIINNRLSNAIVAASVTGVAVSKLNTFLQGKTVNRGWNDSVRLARTQSISSLNGARFDAFKKADNMRITGQKRWVSTYDGRTRKTHKELQGETIDLYSHFSNGLLYPRDPFGDASEVVNCRCTISYILDDTESYDYAKSFGESDYEIEEMLDEMRW